jgi:hypothetical protein
MITHSAVAAVSDRRRRSEIDATIYVALYKQFVGKVCLGIQGDYGYEFTLQPTADGRMLFRDETLVLGGEAAVESEPITRRLQLGAGHTEAKLKDRLRGDFGWAGARAEVPGRVYGGPQSADNGG